MIDEQEKRKQMSADRRAMKKAGRQITVLAMILLSVCIFWRLFHRNTMTLRIPTPSLSGQEAGAGDRPESGPEEGVDGRNIPDVQIVPGEDEDDTFPDDIARFGEPVYHDGFIEVPMQPQKSGDAWYEVHLGEENVYVISARISRLLTVYDKSTGSFTGERIVLCAVALFFILTSLILLRCFLKEKGPGMYSYFSIYSSGFGVFSGICGMVMASVTIFHLLDPMQFSMMEVYRMISGAAYHFILWTGPCILIFSLLLAFSNIELLRHEAFRLQNVLGILAALVITGGATLGVILQMRDFSGSIQAMRVHETINNLYCTVYAYCECMLLGSVVCGIRAALHKPEMDQDYIIILGCRFRRDGSLTPLLRARCDAALDFRRKQLEQTGKEAILVPSGGQGPDESMPEAQAMGRYLLECEVPESSIRREDRSRNTYQNMEFSKKIIEAENPDAKVLFATSEYHVFRSGVWAGLAGLKAEGVGARTKWWFWPNAFMRECLGLLRSRIRQEAVGLVVMAAFFGLLTVLLI